MSIERLRALEKAVELVAKATPGPWRVDDTRDDIEVVGRPARKCKRYGKAGEWAVAKVEDQDFDFDTTGLNSANAIAIASAVNFIREHGSALIAELGQEVGAVVPVSELARLLPGPYYMDPPDGGDVSVLEQLQRMSVDARCWREHISGAAIFDFGPVAWIAPDNALQFNEDFIESGLWQPGVRFYTCPQDVGMTPEDDTSPAHTSEAGASHDEAVKFHMAAAIELQLKLDNKTAECDAAQDALKEALSELSRYTEDEIPYLATPMTEYSEEARLRYEYEKGWNNCRALFLASPAEWITRRVAHTSEARDAELIRALRNQYVSERTFRFQCENGMDYENARAHAESAVNQFEASFIAARERHAAMRQEGGNG